MFLTLVYTLVVLLSQFHYGHGHYYKKAYYPRSYGKYEFGYRIRDPYLGSDFGHQEEKVSDNSQKVTGQYHVLLPNNKVQVVSYYADHTGYHPTIYYFTKEEWLKLNHKSHSGSLSVL